MKAEGAGFRLNRIKKKSEQLPYQNGISINPYHRLRCPARFLLFCPTGTSVFSRANPFSGRFFAASPFLDGTLGVARGNEHPLSKTKT
jgi:hypothetical protein